MRFKIGIGLIIAVVIGLLMLSGMLGKLIGLAISLLAWGATGHLAGKALGRRWLWLAGQHRAGHRRRLRWRADYRHHRHHGFDQAAVLWGAAGWVAWGGLAVLGSRFFVKEDAEE